VTTESGTALDRPARRALLTLARASIAKGLAEGRPASTSRDAWPKGLWEKRATFVTLTDASGRLRGCRGVLDPCRPLPVDVAENAYASAFDDPRFPPLRAAELVEVRLSISLLTPREPLPAPDREALLGALRPGRDGLIVEAGAHRATFLPKVWAELPRGTDFLDHLWHKAGLNAATWPPTLRLWRYEAIDFGEGDPPRP
jgi:AmmeMemoRadiSam system protein A